MFEAQLHGTKAVKTKARNSGRSSIIEVMIGVEILMMV
jgi:hypothetical protein